MALLRRKRRKRKLKLKPRKPAKAVGCKPSTKTAKKKAAPRKKSAAARKPSRRAAKPKAGAASRSAGGSSAGGGADATAAAKRRAALARDRKAARCAQPKRRRATRKAAAGANPGRTSDVTVSRKKHHTAPVSSSPTETTEQASVVEEPLPESPPPPPGEPGFGPREAQRLLWRASCGPRPGEVDRLVAMGRDAAVEHLLDPGTDTLEGPAPIVNGQALRPYDVWGHDHLQWLDGLVRGTHGLRWRMTLVWHDWFACSGAKVPRNLMMRQGAKFHELALGRFDDLATQITYDPAMLVFLDGIRNARWSPNENYAREFFELFMLGANRDAYTEQDIREAARALTGFTASWSGSTWTNFRFDPNRYDAGTKTIFGQTGAFHYLDVVRLALEHPEHASWFVTRLWGAFVGEPADAETQARLERVYLDGGRQVVPVLREILKHPRFYEGPAMVVPPAVLNAGLLRALGRGIDTDAWVWIGNSCGQVLLRPPNVSGWREESWLGTAAFQGRWTMATYALRPSTHDPHAPYDATETAGAALDKALAHLGGPVLTPETHAALLSFAEDLCPPTLTTWQSTAYRAMRQNALRMLIATSSDLACC